MASKISNRSVPVDTILPHVAYRDLAQAVDWLTKTFGFVENYRYGGETGGAQMHLGDAWIMLMSKGERWKVPAELGCATQCLTVFVDDVDVHYERAKAQGAKIIEEPHETVYGERQYAAEDLDGHLWLFSKHARDTDPRDFGATLAAI